MLLVPSVLSGKAVTMHTRHLQRALRVCLNCMAVRTIVVNIS